MSLVGHFSRNSRCRNVRLHSIAKCFGGKGGLCTQAIYLIFQSLSSSQDDTLVLELSSRIALLYDTPPQAYATAWDWITNSDRCSSRCFPMSTNLVLGGWEGGMALSRWCDCFKVVEVVYNIFRGWYQVRFFVFKSRWVLKKIILWHLRCVMVKIWGLLQSSWSSL